MFTAIAEHEDMYAAIDLADKRMLTELKKYKGKLHPQTRGGKRELGGEIADEVLAGGNVE